MSKEDHQIVEFWVVWSEFSILKHHNEGRELDWTVWSKCNQPSILKDYENSIFKVNFNQNKKRVIKENDKMKERIEEFKCKEEIKSDLEWQIWNELADLENNLKWLNWSKIFWSDCLINWMLKDSTWPNWRMKMSKSTVIKDRDWKKFIQYMEAEKSKLDNLICEKHKAEWKMYWMNWAYSLWYKWMITGIHKDHEFVDFSEPSRAQKIVNDLLTDEHSALNDRIMKANMIENWRLISRNITEEVSKLFHELISETWNSLDVKNDSIYIVWRIKNLIKIWRNELQLKNY